jgi:hypothetical protein
MAANVGGQCLAMRCQAVGISRADPSIFREQRKEGVFVFLGKFTTLVMEAFVREIPPVLQIAIWQRAAQSGR